MTASVEHHGQLTTISRAAAWEAWESLPCLGDTLAAVEAAQLTLTLDGDRIGMTGPAAPSPLVVLMLKECKPLLVVVLRHRTTGAPFSWRDCVATWPTVTFTAYRRAVDALVAGGVSPMVAERQAYPAFSDRTPRLLAPVSESTP